MHTFHCVAAPLLMVLAAGFLGAAGTPQAAPAAATDPSAPIHEAAYPPGVKIKVACVGDSITEGSGSGAPSGASNAYVAQLQRMLGDRFDVRNFGVGGTTLLNKGDKPYQKQAAFAQSKTFAPDVVVIMLGTNDTKPQNWAFKDEFVADYKDLADQYAALAGKPRIFVCHPCFVPGAGNYGINEANVLLEIPLIDALARELKLGVIDIHGATKDKEAIFPDHVHPNNDGAELLAKTVYQTLAGKEYKGAGTIITAASRPATQPAAKPAP